jgi:hypothetical protein
MRKFQVEQEVVKAIEPAADAIELSVACVGEVKTDN